MQQIRLLILLALISVQSAAQTKHAFIFSRLATVDAPAKTIARNNINVIKEGLQLQGVSSANIVVDSLGAKAKTLGWLRSLEQRVKRGDFVFLYFDLPFGIEEGKEKALKIVLDPSKPGEFIYAHELQAVLTNISRKINDPAVFTVAFDADGLSTEELNGARKFEVPGDLHINYFFACSNGEQRSFHNETSVFALSFTHALGSISSYNITYRGFFNNLRRHTLLLTASQRPQLVGNAADMMLFNGAYIRYPVHFKILDQPDPNTVVINAGERLNIFPGSKTKFYKAYTDTLPFNYITEGTIISATDYTATIRLTEGRQLDREKVWAHVGNAAGNNIYKVKLNTQFGGTGRLKELHTQLIKRLSSSSLGRYLQLVDKGGDLQIRGLSESAGSLVATITDPISGMVYRDFDISGDDITELDEYIRNLSRYEKLFRVTNDIPELSLQVDVTYSDSLQRLLVDNGYPVLYQEDEVKLRLTNRNNIPVYFGLVDLQPDKKINPLVTGDAPSEFRILPGQSYELELIITPPFGMERLKIITSLSPIDVGNFATANVTRGADLSSRFENLNIQEFDFEIRDRFYATRNAGEPSAAGSTVTSVVVKKQGKTSLNIKNETADRVYVNLIRSDENGRYTLLLPAEGQPDAAYFIDRAAEKSFETTAELKAMDQLITIYADRPFTLSQYTSEDRQLSDLVLEIIRNGKISGSPMNKLALSQQLYDPATEIVMRDADPITIKLVTPKLSPDRSLGIKVKSILYDINGFAIGAGNKPVKAMRINGEEVKYDRALLFFDQTIKLVAGKNRVVIEAEDEKGFKEIQNLDIELENAEVTAAGPGKNYFLGIAIDNYKTWPRLYNARNDVNSVAEMLGRRYGFEKDNMSFLMDAAATRKGIIESIRSFVSKAGPNDNVVIYFSGHGNEDQLADGEYYFIPQDADAEDVSSAVSSADILVNFKKIRARHCILIVDACYSGMITNSAGADQKVLSTDQVIPLEQLPSKWIITSGRGTKVSDGSDGNSPFTRVLLNYLREKSEPADLKITAVINYLVDNVVKLSPKQLPLGVSIQGQGVPVFKVVSDPKK